MVRRFIGGNLFDILPGGTALPIVSAIPPRKLPMMITKELLQVEDVIGEFLSQFSIPVVILPDIPFPVPDLPPHVSDDTGTPTVINEPSPIVGMPQPPTEIGGEPIPLGDRIYTRFGLATQEVSDAIREFWPPSQHTNAAELSYLESGWHTNAINDTVSIYGPCGTRYFLPSIGGWAQTELSVGYFQINICAHGGTIAMWQDPRNNARKAAELYHGSGDKYTPWAISAGRLGLRA